MFGISIEVNTIYIGPVLNARELERTLRGFN